MCIVCIYNIHTSYISLHTKWETKREREGRERETGLCSKFQPTQGYLDFVSQKQNTHTHQTFSRNLKWWCYISLWIFQVCCYCKKQIQDLINTSAEKVFFFLTIFKPFFFLLQRFQQKWLSIIDGLIP